MTVVEILDAKGATQKIDVQTSGEGLEQLVADLGLKSVAEAIKTLLEGTAVVKVTDNAGSLTVDAPLSTPVGVRLSDGTSAIGSTAQRIWVDDGGSTLSVDDGAGSLTVDGTVSLGAGTAEVGKVKVTELPALPTGSNAIGKLAANGGINIGNVGLVPQTTGGLEIKRVLSAASTNATSVKASTGQVYGWYIFNTSAAVKYVKLYNKASAPTVGTDTPVMTIPVPKESGTNIEYVNGIAFATGIALATTKGVLDANTEAVAENDLIINILWK